MVAVRGEQSSRLKRRCEQSAALEGRDGFALFPPAGEVPIVRKGTALRGLHGLEAAVATFEPFAGVVGLFQKREPAAVGAQPRVAVDEVLLGHPDVCGDGGDFVGVHADDAGPAAAVRAALAGVVDGGVLGQGGAFAGETGRCRAGKWGASNHSCRSGGIDPPPGGRGISWLLVVLLL